MGIKYKWNWNCNQNDNIFDGLRYQRQTHELFCIRFWAWHLVQRLRSVHHAKLPFLAKRRSRACQKKDLLGILTEFGLLKNYIACNDLIDLAWRSRMLVICFEAFGYFLANKFMDFLRDTCQNQHGNPQGFSGWKMNHWNMFFPTSFSFAHWACLWIHLALGSLGLG